MDKTNDKQTNKDEVQIVGVGASAGGLEALQELISHLPVDLDNIAIVIAQHLSPTYKSMLVQLLSRQTKLEVVEVRNHLPVKANTIYITPPDSEITFAKGYFSLKKPPTSMGPKPSIDTFFTSLANDRTKEAIGVILSGTGSDGAVGIKNIKAAGGITIAQEPHTAKYDGMPISAIETGQIDLVLPPDKIGEELLEILQFPDNSRITKPILESPKSSLDKILNLLSQRTGTDFANYKPSTICRRLEKRIVELKLQDIDKYLAYVSEHPNELDALFDNILIGVTTFFRDAEAFELLEKYIFNIISTKKKGDQIRIWIPGCATGEEAYSFALIFAKLLTNRIQDYNIQIFATDIDEKAINTARKGIYSKEVLANVPDDLREAYILKKGDNYEVIKSIRQLILFSKHDVTSNPPFLKLDMISCRNLLIYFGQNLQKHVIPIFHYALNPEGYLFLGKSETVGQFTDLFSTIDGKSKIFQRKRGNHLHTIKFSTFKPQTYNVAPKGIRGVKSMSQSQPTIADMVKETLFNTFENPYVIIDDNMDILEVYGDVRAFLEVKVGVMNANILKMSNKDLQIELRTLISKTIKDNLINYGKLKRLEFFDKIFYVRIVVKPLLYSNTNNALFLVIFEQHDFEDSFLPPLEVEIKGDNLKVLELEHELASTKEHLQTFVEELETANEELQSLNEELQSSNEELQSSNEELETSNEELQSTNEELQIAYAELKTASEEIEKQTHRIKSSEANAKALLNNTLQSFVLVNRDYRIISFNQRAVEVYLDLYGRLIKNGDSMIDYNPEGEIDLFHKEFRKALDGEVVSNEKSIKNTSGELKWFSYNYTPVVSDNNIVEIVSFSKLDISSEKQIQKELTQNEKLINSIFNVADIGICVTNKEGKFVKVNQTYCDIYGYEMDEVIGQPFTIVVPEENREYASNLHKRFLEGHPESPGRWRVMRKDGKLISIHVTAARLIGESGDKFKVTTVTPLPEQDE